MSNRKIYRINLTGEEREAFIQVANGIRGQLKIVAWKVQWANAMLMCDESEDGRVRLGNSVFQGLIEFQ